MTENLVGQTVVGKLGNYLLNEYITRSARSAIYKAIWKEQQERVCVKALELSRAKTIENFNREGKILSLLEHPNIIRLIDYVSSDGLYYIIMELMPEGSLADQLRIKGPLSLSEICPILLQISSALDYAHKSKIIHGDVKPSNILLDDNRAILTDFGVARIILTTTSTKTTTENMRLGGTFSYSAPESLDGVYGPDADQYSLAVSAYELVTGKLPFESDSLPGLVREIALGTPIPPRDLNPSIPTSVEEVILKGMAREPSERFQNILDFANEFFAAVRTISQPESLTEKRLFEATPPLSSQNTPTTKTTTKTQQTKENHGNTTTITTVITTTITTSIMTSDE